MAFRHNHSSVVVVVEKSIVDVEVMEPIKDKVVAMIEPSLFDPELMGVVGKLDRTKPLLKVVLPFGLVDNESVEVIDDIVPVWIDTAQTEFNPATMAKVAWNQTVDAMPSKRNSQTIGKRKVYEDIYDSVIIGNDAKVDGDVYGSVTVKAGIKVLVGGDVYGVAQMEHGSEMIVDGDLYGHINNDGGIVRVYGDMYGQIKNINGGQSFLEDDDSDQDEEEDCDDMDDENECENGDGGDYDDIYDSLTIDHDATVGGDIYGLLTVKLGIKVVVDGDVHGTVKMEQGSEMFVKGDVHGLINNDGGTVHVFGDMHGKINNVNGGQSFLESDSESREKIPNLIRNAISAPFKKMLKIVVRSIGSEPSSTESSKNSSLEEDKKDDRADEQNLKSPEMDCDNKGKEDEEPRQY